MAIMEPLDKLQLFTSTMKEGVENAVQVQNLMNSFNTSKAESYLASIELLRPKKEEGMRERDQREEK